MLRVVKIDVVRIELDSMTIPSIYVLNRDIFRDSVNETTA